MADDKITAEDEELEGEEKKPEVPAKGEDGNPPSKKEDDEIPAEDEEAGEKEDDEIPVRTSVAQHIIDRQRRTIKKLRSKDEEDGETEEEAPAEDEDDLTPSARKALSREVEKHINPLVETLAARADGEELNQLISTEPEAEKYRGRIEKYMANPHYKGVPPAVIFHHLAFQAASGVKESRRVLADKEAKQEQGAGSARRPNTAKLPSGIPSVEDMDAMTDAEFEALEHKARAGGFVEKG